MLWQGVFPLCFTIIFRHLLFKNPFGWDQSQCCHHVVTLNMCWCPQSCAFCTNDNVSILNSRLNSQTCMSLLLPSCTLITALGCFQHRPETTHPSVCVCFCECVLTENVTPSRSAVSGPSHLCAEAFISSFWLMWNGERKGSQPGVSMATSLGTWWSR